MTSRIILRDRMRHKDPERSGHIPHAEESDSNEHLLSTLWLPGISQIRTLATTKQNKTSSYNHAKVQENVVLNGLFS